MRPSFRDNLIETWDLTRVAVVWRLSPVIWSAKTCYFTSDGCGLFFHRAFLLHGVDMLKNGAKLSFQSIVLWISARDLNVTDGLRLLYLEDVACFLALCNIGKALTGICLVCSCSKSCTSCGSQGMCPK